MPYTNINGVAINYEILGNSGPPMALSPGGRNPYQHIMPIAEQMAAKGYRVLLHDRRNCGASDASFDPSRSEYEVWADDLDALLKQFDMAPAIIGGSSSGARLALTFALRHPQSVRALVLWRVTGGGFAVKRLAERYYDQYVRLAGEGGMAAVCAEEHFAELIRKRPSNRERLMAFDPQQFIKIMQAWRAPFVAGAELPLIGTSEQRPAVDPRADLHHPGQRPHARQCDRQGGGAADAGLRGAQPRSRGPERRHRAGRGVVQDG